MTVDKKHEHHRYSEEDIMMKETQIYNDFLQKRYSLNNVALTSVVPFHHFFNRLLLSCLYWYSLESFVFT